MSVTAEMAACPRVLVVDNHDSYTYNVVRLIAEVVGMEPAVVQHDRLDLEAVLRAGFTHIVISPGPGHPARPADFGVNLELIRRADAAVLGICLGHQGIAQAFGGAVTVAEPAHGKVDAVQHDGTGLFRGLPQGFPAVRYHSLAVTSLLDPLRVIARSGDGTIMALQHRDRPIHGVQFHPESILTQHGAALMANFFGLDAARGAARSRSMPTVETSEVPAEAPARHAAAQVRRLDVWAEPAAVVPAGAAGPPAAGPKAGLDSSASRPWSGRFSYLGWLGPDGLSATYDVATGTVTEHRATGSRPLATTIFDYLDDALAGEACPPLGAPFAFQGGWIGYFGYECKADTFGRRAHGARTPDACFLRVRSFLAFDHAERTVYAVAEARSGFDALEHAVRRGQDWPQKLPTPPSGRVRVAETWSREKYRAAFADVQRELRAGNTYELNLTYQTLLESAAPPMAVYRALREESPTPYSAYLEHRGVAVLSSSMERFLTIDADRAIDVRPIKGTTPRGATPQEDVGNRWLLAHEPRYQAENLMIVDLLRNDISRICEPGTVQVPELMAVESYASVHQLVTTVQGRLRPDQNAVDAMRALFPSGSMTGAPKERTMEIIDAVETSARGVYSGALGWFGCDGRADFSVVIRTLVAVGGRYSFGVGGGVIALSEPDSELEETAWKAERMLRALERASGSPIDLTPTSAVVAAS